MSQARNKIQWCLNKAKRECEEGKKHRGLLKVYPNSQKALEYITKAEHNLEVTLYLKGGYETRNQECTFAVIASLIEDKKISLKKEDLDSVSTLDAAGAQEASPTVVNIREEYQYGSKVSLGDNEYEQLLALSMKIMDKTKGYIL